VHHLTDYRVSDGRLIIDTAPADAEFLHLFADRKGVCPVEHLLTFGNSALVSADFEKSLAKVSSPIFVEGVFTSMVGACDLAVV
jgi:hypothetical protein